MVLAFILAKHIYVLRRRRRKPSLYRSVLYRSFKAAKKKRKENTTVWRVSRVAAINIDVRADVTSSRAAVWRGHRCAWPESGRPSCYPLQLYQRTVIRSLGDFFFLEKKKKKIQQCSSVTEELSGTQGRRAKGWSILEKHTATSNQSVLYVPFEKKWQYHPSVNSFHVKGWDPSGWMSSRHRSTTRNWAALCPFGLTV